MGKRRKKKVMREYHKISARGGKKDKVPWKKGKEGNKAAVRWRALGKKEKKKRGKKHKTIA